MSRHPTDTGGGICNAIPHCKRDEIEDCPACHGLNRLRDCEYCNGAGEVKRKRADIIRRQLQCNGTRIG